MKRKLMSTRFEWVILLLAAILLGGAWITVSREPVVAERGLQSLTEAPIVGHLAPDFVLETAVGQQVTLSELIEADSTGRPVVLNFWASWCAPCRVEMPHLQNAAVKYNGRAAILGVNQGETAETVADFGAEYNISYPLLVDTDYTVNNLYAVRGLPTTVFIDADGIVREVVLGAVTQAVLEERLDNLIAEANAAAP